MKDRRQSKRWLLSQYLTVHHADDVFGRIVDVTTTGIRLISAQTIPLEKRYSIRFTAPLTTGGDCELNLDIISRWSRSDINPDFHDTGFTYTDISPLSKLVILNLVDNIGFHQPD